MLIINNFKKNYFIFEYNNVHLILFFITFSNLIGLLFYCMYWYMYSN